MKSENEEMSEGVKKALAELRLVQIIGGFVMFITLIILIVKIAVI